MEVKIRVALFFMLLLMVVSVTAVFYPEPWGTDVDAGNNNLNNVDNVTANNFIGTLVGASFGEVSGPMNWTALQNYPVGCPGSSAITLLNDSVTCSDLWTDSAGDVMTGSLNMSSNNVTNVDRLYFSGYQNSCVFANGSGLQMVWNKSSVCP